MARVGLFACELQLHKLWLVNSRNSTASCSNSSNWRVTHSLRYTSIDTTLLRSDGLGISSAGPGQPFRSTSCAPCWIVYSSFLPHLTPHPHPLYNPIDSRDGIRRIRAWRLIMVRHENEGTAQKGSVRLAVETFLCYGLVD